MPVHFRGGMGPPDRRRTAVKGKKRAEQPPRRPSPADLVQEAHRNYELGTALNAFDAVRPYLPEMNRQAAPNVTFATGTNQ